MEYEQDRILKLSQEFYDLHTTDNRTVIRFYEKK